MLVCSVSLRPRRSAIAAELAEVTAADDASTTGFVVFATLVDDPANVLETVDAFLGDIMVEVASAVDVVSLLIPLDANVAEAASASDAPDAFLGAFVTFDSHDTGGTAMSNGNLTATHTGTFGQTGARSTAYRSSGKYYFEVTMGATNGGGDTIGILLSTGVYNDQQGGNNSATVFSTFSSGIIYSNNANTGIGIGAAAPGDVTGIAIDLDNRKAWFRRNGGNWNASGTANPATNVGGVTIGSGSFAPSIAFGSGSSTVGDNVTGNFGQSAYAFSPPSGFGNWPP
jgi:hypothetical protein